MKHIQRCWQSKIQANGFATGASRASTVGVGREKPDKIKQILDTATPSFLNVISTFLLL
jgi:hypothetical protein